MRNKAFSQVFGTSFLVVIALVLAMGCEPPPSTRVTCLDLELDSSSATVLWGESQLAKDAATLVSQIDVLSGTPVTVTLPSIYHETFVCNLEEILEVAPENYAITDTADPGAVADPDVLVTQANQDWAISPSDNYGLAEVRLGDNLGVRSVRKIEIHNRWEGNFPKYFPPVTVAGKTPTRIAALGHLRGLVASGYDSFKSLYAEAVNVAQPQSIYMMGDMIRYSEDEEYDRMEEHMFDLFNAPYYFTPGNHEARSLVTIPDGSGDKYNDDVVFMSRGYAGAPTSVNTDDYVNMVTFDSNKPLNEVTLHLTDTLDNQVDSSLPTWLFGHHRVFEYPIRDDIHQHFTPDEFLAIVVGKVQTVFAGDYSDALYDLGEPRGWKGQGINAYLVGSGENSASPLSYAIIQIGEAGIQRYTPVYLDAEKSHFYY